MSAVAKWAPRYVERFGFALVPLQGKVPVGSGWNRDENLLRTASAAADHFNDNPAHNVGVCLEPSRLASIDADYLEGATRVLAAEGIDLDAMMTTTPTIIGRAPRLEFAAPEVPLTRKSVVWPPKVPGEKPITVLEFRAGRVQDVLPPSIHPDTHQPYRWHTPPSNGFPPLPAELLTLWLDFEHFKHRARNLCPWAEAETADRVIRPRTAPYIGKSVISAFNAAHDPVAILESHGYQRAGERRWKSPHGHNMAGLVLLPSGKVYCHHASDPLGDDLPHDSFDLYVRFNHGGDFRKAVKAAADLLGLNQGSRAPA
jgi:putative DNA primase/helicase